MFWVRPLTVEGVGILLAWLDDVLPGRAERTEFPLWDDEASRKEIESPTGQALLLWLALRDNGVSFQDVFTLQPTEIETCRIHSVLFGRRRTMGPVDPENREDISRLWCAEAIAAVARRIGMTELGKLTLDQFDWLVAGGELNETGDDTPTSGLARAMEMYRAAKAAEDAEKAANGEPVDAVNGLIPPGWKIKEDDIGPA